MRMKLRFSAAIPLLFGNLWFIVTLTHLRTSRLRRFLLPLLFDIVIVIIPSLFSLCVTVRRLVFITILALLPTYRRKRKIGPSGAEGDIDKVGIGGSSLSWLVCSACPSSTPCNRSNFDRKRGREIVSN